jgi:nucleotide-binding universal stress UspA family protein
MRTISRILLATDFSDPSEHAQAYAFALARRLKASLHIVHVVDTAYPSYAGVYGFGVEVELRIDQAKRYAQDQLDRLTDAARDRGIAAQSHVLETHPPEAIVDEAVATSCDLVVIGTHGWSGIDRFLFGSTAERVVRLSTVPVLAVKAREKEFLEMGEMSINCVMCPCDLSPVSEQAVGLAADVCRLFDAELVLLHVIDDRANYPLMIPEATLPSPAELQANVDQRLKALAGKFLGIESRTLVVRGVPHKEILAQALNAQVDLLVMSTHGYRGVTRMVLGSTVEKVVRTSPLPTLTVKPEMAEGA